MSAAQDNEAAGTLKIDVLREISALSKADQVAVHGAAHKVRLAIAEGNAQEEGLGLLALALISAELQEQTL